MRIDPNYSMTLASEIDRSSANEQRLTNELSSGLRVATLQDDPVAAAQSSRLNTAISRDDVYTKTATQEEAMLQASDTTLGSVTTVLTSAISLAVKAGDGTLNAANTATIANQLSSLRDQLLSLANTSYLGQPLFAGSSSTTPYVLDTTTSPVGVSYKGDTQIQHIETPGGQKVQTNVPGVSIFGDGTSGALAALNKLIADLSTGPNPSAAAPDSAALSDALATVSSQRTILDNSLSTIRSTQSYAQTDETFLKAQQTTLTTADPVIVASDLKSAETQHQALLSVMAAIQQVNLFSYMK